MPIDVVSGETDIITINYPKVFGALGREGKFELTHAVENTKASSVVLTGTGKAFCSGQNLEDRSVQGEVDLGKTLETEWNPLINAIRQCPRPVICAINGVCAGAGLSLAFACDLVVAKPKLRFVSGFTAIGLTPDAGSSFAFTRALGPKRAMEFFLWNRPLFTEDLCEAGLINQASEDVLETAKSWARDINAMAPLAVIELKKNIQLAFEGHFEESMQRETSAQHFLGNSKDYKEGLSAFLEKRSAQFQGS